MDTPLRFLFDECVSHKAIAGLEALLLAVGRSVTFQHIFHMQLDGVFDEVWIPQIANDGFVVVTGDRGAKQKAKKGEKLPILCERFGVSYATFSSTLHNHSNEAKIRYLHALWPQIEAIHSEVRGAGFLIRQHPTKVDPSRVIMVRRDWLLPESERFGNYENPKNTQTSFLPGGE